MATIKKWFQGRYGLLVGVLGLATVILWGAVAGGLPVSVAIHGACPCQVR